MWSAYKKFWKRYTDIKGTSTRSDYWWVHLVNLLLFTIFLVVVIGAGIVAGKVAEGDRGVFQITDLGVLGIFTVIAGLLVVLIYNLATLTPTITLGVRRVRDTGLSGWWFLLRPIGGMVIYMTDVIKNSQSLAFIGAGLLLLYFVITVLPTNTFDK